MKLIHHMGLVVYVAFLSVTSVRDREGNLAPRPQWWDLCRAPRGPSPSPRVIAHPGNSGEGKRVAGACSLCSQPYPGSLGFGNARLEVFQSPKGEAQKL